LKTFNCNTIRDYINLYLESDVLILTDVFENFSKICQKIYKLDPINYVTAPSISWDAMLKYTNVNLELINKIIGPTFRTKCIRTNHINTL